MALLLLLVWTVNTGITQWQQLHTIAVHITPATETTPAYIIEVPPSAPGYNLFLASTYPALARVMPWLALVYCLGLLAMSLRLSLGIFQLRRLRQSVLLPGPKLTSLLHDLQLRLGIMQQVSIRLSARIVMPMVVGVIRPVILLPHTIVDDLSAEGLEAILIHELAHISRADFIINFLQSLVETVLFFNPFAWRISATIRHEREHCCDDLVLLHTSQPLVYARALVSLAGRSADVSSLALAASGNRPLLFNRIKRIIEMKQQPLRYTQFIAACSLAAILITVSIACFTPSFAQQSRKHASEKGNNNANTATRIIVIENGISHVYNSPAELPAEHRKTLEKSIGALKSSKHSEAAEEKSEDELSSVPAPATPAVPPAPSEHGLPAVPPVPAFPTIPEVPEIPDVDVLVGDATKTAREALEGVDWKELRRQLAYANKAMEQVDWTTINRDLNRSLDPERMRRLQHQLYRAQVVIDPKMSKEIRRQVEAARKQAEEARRQIEAAREELRKAKAARENDEDDSTRKEANTNKILLWNEYRPYAWRVPGAPGC